MKAEMELTILEDGTISINTGNMAGEHHASADEFIKLVHQLAGRRRTVLDLAKKANLARSSGLRDRNRIAQLRCIKRDENLAMIAHDSPSLLEALPGLSG